MKIRFVFAWYDFWVGLFWNQIDRKLYILPIPCCGIVLEFDPPPTCDVCGSETFRAYRCWKCSNCGNSMGIADDKRRSEL